MDRSRQTPPPGGGWAQGEERSRVGLGGWGNPPPPHLKKKPVAEGLERFFLRYELLQYAGGGGWLLKTSLGGVGGGGLGPDWGRTPPQGARP